MAKLGLDLSGIDANAGSRFTLVPAGTYCALVIDAQVMPTKTGGYQLVLTHEIKEGAHTGACVRDGINIVNEHVDAQRIGLSMLKQLAILIGVRNPNLIDDSDELLNKKLFSLVLAVESKSLTLDGKVSDFNKVKAYAEYDATKFEHGASQATAIAPPTKDLPWLKK